MAKLKMQYFTKFNSQSIWTWNAIMALVSVKLNVIILTFLHLTLTHPSAYMPPIHPKLHLRNKRKLTFRLSLSLNPSLFHLWSSPDVYFSLHHPLFPSRASSQPLEAPSIRRRNPIRHSFRHHQWFDFAERHICSFVCHDATDLSRASFFSHPLPHWHWMLF